jgi:hypothetical protein
MTEQPTNKYAKLPEPIRLEDTITSHDVEPVPAQKGGPWHEIEWMLRTAAG